MSVNSYDAIAEKILFDLELTLKKHLNIEEFFILPTLEENNKNSSPIIKRENTLGLESWIVNHIYVYAHHEILQKNNYKTQNLNKVIPCLTGVALLNPDMPTVWSRRRELIISKKLNIENELRLTAMALSRKPKCNDALMHRRWIITEMLKDVEDNLSLLREELKLSEMIANRYHSNYHAWSHRMWSLQQLLPDSPFHVRKKPEKSWFLESVRSESADIIVKAISRNQFCHLKNIKVIQVLFQELENNFNWVSTHVSDHSGLHFRKFLVLGILSIFYDFLNLSNKSDFQSDVDDNAQCNPVFSLFSNGTNNINEFLGEFDNQYRHQYRKAVENYLVKLGQELTLFDVSMFLIVTELKSNSSLITLFYNHEALWYYRRFLIFVFKQLIDTLEFCKTNENRSFLHLDRNGVPYKKDFKYDNSTESKPIPKHSDLYGALYLRLWRNEGEIISKMLSHDEHVKTLLKNYNQWLKGCFQMDESFL